MQIESRTYDGHSYMLVVGVFADSEEYGGWWGGGDIGSIRKSNRSRKTRAKLTVLQLWLNHVDNASGGVI